MSRERINALHREAAELVRDGLCAEHLDREIAQLEAASREPPTQVVAEQVVE